MAEVRDDRKYHEGHGWIVMEDNNIGRFGITDFAQAELEEVVVVPKGGARVAQGIPMGEIESLKVISDLIAPASGEVVEINDAIEKDPALVNNAPYEGGWLVRVKLDGLAQIDELLGAAAYATQTNG